LLVAAVLVTMSASGGDALAAPSAAEKETARGLVRSGRVKTRRGNVEGALEDFQAAHAIMNVPTTGIELAKAQVAAGLLVEALDTTLAVTRMPKDRFEPKAFRAARKQAQSLAEELPPKIPAVVIEVTGEGADSASVTVDGKEQRSELLGAPIKLNPGSHEVVATAPGGAEVRETVDLQEGMTREVALRLVAPEAATPVKPDGDGDGSTTNPAVWIGFGVAGAGVIIGTITGSLAMAKYSDVAPRCPDNRCPPDAHGDVDGGKTLGTVATVSFIVGAVGAATGVTALFFPLDDDEDSPEPASELGLGPGFVTWRGRF
jgi:hypothetical protein